MLSRPMVALWLACALPAKAERMPDPLEFLAGIQALQETCARLHPEMKDDAAKLDAQESSKRADDAERMRALKTSPEFPAALRRARAGVLRLPAEKIESECRAMHDEANRQPVPGRY